MTTAQPGGSRCANCGAIFRCGMEAGDKRCWCASLPPLAPLTEVGAGDTARCLCPDCLRQRLAAAPALH